jgi:hypothetical protein
MKYIIPLINLFSLLWLSGCSKDDNSTNPPPPGRTFSGITERNEWGDTLSVDTTDWVLISAALSGMDLPPVESGYSNKNLRILTAPLPSTDSVFSLGAFPNPFIPKAGRMILGLTLAEAMPVHIWLEDESGDLNIPIFLVPNFPQGQYLIAWNGVDSAGNALAEGIYRVYFSSPPLFSYGDVQVIVTDHPNSSLNSPYVQFADDHYSLDQYKQYEYVVATHYGADGNPGGGDCYPTSYTTWQTLPFEDKFQYLPVFMNYDVSVATGYPFYYLLANKHFQFGAGWPEYANVGVSDTTHADWQLQNTIHDQYVILFEQGQ